MSGELAMATGRGNGEQEREKKKLYGQKEYSHNSNRTNLLTIDEHEGYKRRWFLDRMKEEWNKIYEDIPISAQAFRDMHQNFGVTKC